MLDDDGLFAGQSEFLREVTIGTAQVGVAAHHNGTSFMHRLHRLFITVRKTPEGRRPECLLKLIHADVQRAALLIAVHYQFYSVLAITHARKCCEILLR